LPECSPLSLHDALPILARGGLRREAMGVEGARDPLAAPAGCVTGEHPAGAVPAVGGRGEANQQQPSGRLAETWHRTSPVGLTERSEEHTSELQSRSDLV